jgi:hypothetical protein
MNTKLTKEEFLEIMTVFVVEQAKAEGKDLASEDPADLSEYQQLLAHIAKYPMKTDLKMAKFKVDAREKLLGKRLITAMEKADSVRLLI